MRGVFITGSDAGVGKTTVGAALAWRLSLLGRTVRPRKPVEADCAEWRGGSCPRDGETYRVVTGGREALEHICCYSLKGRAVSLDDLVRVCCDGTRAGDFLLVEGAGGFYSPLAGDVLNADLAAALRLPVVVVSADRPGAIHQTLLTADAVARRGLALAGVVLNETTPGTHDRTHNLEDLARWLGRELTIIPYYDAAGDTPVWQAIAPYLTAIAASLAADAVG